MEKTPNSANLRSVDRDVLVALRTLHRAGIGDLVETLEVTATAVRQRIERLLESGLIEREKVVAGRGRPTYRYRLSDSGLRHTSADTTALAEAMWTEIVAIEDDQMRRSVIDAVASRLGSEFADKLGHDDVPLADRMQKLVGLLSNRQVDGCVSQDGALPVLDIGLCPYPSLASASEDREMCRMEEQMLSEALGKPVHLSSCRLDGDACCQFSAGTHQGSHSN